jgi:hypothetical protein
VCWNITRVTLWLLCNVHLVCKVQIGCLCKQKSSGSPLTTEDDVERVWVSFLRSLKKSMGIPAKELSMSKARVWRVLISIWCFLVINVCNQGEHYKTPCIETTSTR